MKPDETRPQKKMGGLAAAHKELTLVDLLRRWRIDNHARRHDRTGGKLVIE